MQVRQFSWDEEIQEPLDTKTLQEIKSEKYKEIIKTSWIFLLMAFIAVFLGYCLYNYEILTKIFAAGALIAFIIGAAIMSGQLDIENSFSFITLKDKELLEQYHKLVSINCPEIKAFDEALRLLKRFPTRGELEALQKVALRRLKGEVEEAFLYRDWSKFFQIIEQNF